MNLINQSLQPSKRRVISRYSVIILVFFIVGLYVAQGRARNDLVSISEQMWSTSSLDSTITSNTQCSQCADLQVFTTLDNPSSYDVEVNESIVIYAGSKPLSQLEGSTVLPAGKSGVIELTATFSSQELEEMRQFAVHSEASYTVTAKFLGVVPFSHAGVCPVNVFPVDASTPKAITIENAVVVPTDASKIDYPSAFNDPAITSVQVIDPYFAIEREEIAYPAEYLGDYEYPQVNGAPLSTDIKRIVGLHDLGIPDWTFLHYVGGVDETARALERQGILEAMKRAQSLGADEITFTNMINFVDFEKAELEPLPNVPVSSDDFRFIANNAEELGLDTTLCLNLFVQNADPWDYPILSKDWYVNLIHNWGTFVLNQAQLSEETGVDALMINHFDWQPYIKGYEDVYQAEMLALLENVRTVYHGRILFLLDPVMGSDLDKLSELLSSVDGFIINAIPLISYASDKTVSVSNLKGLFLTDFRNIVNEYNRFNKPYLVRVLIQSEKTFLENGWNEDTHCIARGNDTCYQKRLEVDFSVQAVAYEAMLEAIEQLHTEESMMVYGVEATGYWFLDVILPHISHPQISQSVRDKPAEVLIYQWFKR